MKKILLSMSLVLSMAGIAQEAKPEAFNSRLKESNLLFLENKGQVLDEKGHAAQNILFSAKSAGARLWLTSNAIHYQFTKADIQIGNTPEPKVKKEPIQTHRFTLQLAGSNPNPQVIKEKESAYFENYYGNYYPAAGVSVKSYGKIIYKNVYPNIDWEIYSDGKYLEYDFIVRPGGDPARIKLKITDADGVSITQKGELLIKTRLGEVREKAPVSFDASGNAIATRFVQHHDGSIGFSGNFPKAGTFRIDPEVVWSTYYGGEGYESIRGCVADSDNNIYAAGLTQDSDDLASGGFQNTYGGGGSDAFLVKFDAEGNRLWATYYGGGGDDSAESCTIDSENNVYICGYTTSTSGIAYNGFQESPGGNDNADALLVKFDSNGSRLWATYYGGFGFDAGFSCAVDSDDNIYFCGDTGGSGNSVIASGGFQNTQGGSSDGFLAKFDSGGDRIWATFYGGSSHETARSCTVDIGDNVYICGGTESTSNIAFNGFQNVSAGGLEGYLVKFDSSGDRLWSTYYGGGMHDGASSIASGSDGTVYLIGVAQSAGLNSSGFPEKTGFDNEFIAKFDDEGNRLWARYYGNQGASAINTGKIGCDVDNEGNFYLVGASLPEVSEYIPYLGFQDEPAGSSEVYIAKFDPDGIPIWSSFFGSDSADIIEGCATDNDHNVYIFGWTMSESGITQDGFQEEYGGGYNDGFLVKINGELSSAISISELTSEGPFCAGSLIEAEVTTTGSFPDGNIFSFQLSDASGSFDNPAVLYDYEATTVGFMSGTIPQDTPEGTGYRVRVISSNGLTVPDGSDNGTDITINNPIAPVGDEEQTVTTADAATVTLAGLEVTGENITWYQAEDSALAGTNPIPATTVVTSGMTYYATQTINGCEGFPLAVAVEVLLGNENFNPADFAYYPNPVTNMLHVRGEHTINGISFYNIIGQRVLHEIGETDSADISVESLPEGSYVVKIDFEGGTQSFQLIKL